MKTLNRVTVYTQPQCRSCDRVKSKLVDAGVEFEAIDILQDPASYDFVKNVLGARSVPVVVSDVMAPIFGYQPDRLQHLILELRDYTEVHDYIFEGE